MIQLKTVAQLMIRRVDTRTHAGVALSSSLPATLPSGGGMFTLLISPLPVGNSTSGSGASSGKVLDAFEARNVPLVMRASATVVASDSSVAQLTMCAATQWAVSAGVAQNLLCVLPSNKTFITNKTNASSSAISDGIVSGTVRKTARDAGSYLLEGNFSLPPSAGGWYDCTAAQNLSLS